MPDTSSYSGLPVPLLSEAANLPAALTDFRDDLEPHIVLFATSVSDMTSSYGAAPLGTVVSIPSIPAMYQKVASGWRVTSEDTGWQTIADANFEADWDNISSAWRRVNGYTMVDIRATFTGVTERSSPHRRACSSPTSAAAWKLPTCIPTDHSTT